MEAGKPRDFQVALLVTHTLSLHKQKCIDPISSGPNTFFLDYLNGSPDSTRCRKELDSRLFMSLKFKAELKSNVDYNDDLGSTINSKLF